MAISFDFEALERAVERDMGMAECWIRPNQRDAVHALYTLCRGEAQWRACTITDNFIERLCLTAGGEVPIEARRMLSTKLRNLLEPTLMPDGFLPYEREVVQIMTLRDIFEELDFPVPRLVVFCASNVRGELKTHRQFEGNLAARIRAQAAEARHGDSLPVGGWCDTAEKKPTLALGPLLAPIPEDFLWGHSEPGSGKMDHTLDAVRYATFVNLQQLRANMGLPVQQLDAGEWIQCSACGSTLPIKRDEVDSRRAHFCGPCGRLSPRERKGWILEHHASKARRQIRGVNLNARISTEAIGPLRFCLACNASLTLGSWPAATPPRSEFCSSCEKNLPKDRRDELLLLTPVATPRRRTELRATVRDLSKCQICAQGPRVSGSNACCKCLGLLNELQAEQDIYSPRGMAQTQEAMAVNAPCNETPKPVSPEADSSPENVRKQCAWLRSLTNNAELLKVIDEAEARELAKFGPPQKKPPAWWLFPYPCPEEYWE